MLIARVGQGAVFGELAALGLASSAMASDDLPPGPPPSSALAPHDLPPGPPLSSAEQQGDLPPGPPPRG